MPANGRRYLIRRLKVKRNLRATKQKPAPCGYSKGRIHCTTEFPEIFGHGTLFNSVNIYGTQTFCGPSFTEKKSAQ